MSESRTYFPTLLCTLALMVLTNCADKSRTAHLWDNYATTPSSDTHYVDNDEYYVAPTSSYSGGGAMLDPD